MDSAGDFWMSFVPDVHSVVHLPPGLSGARMTRVSGQVDVFVKWADVPHGEVADKIRAEVRHLQSCPDLPGVVKLLHADETVPLLATEAVPADPASRWDQHNWESVVYTLSHLRRVPFQDLGLVADLASFEDRGPLTRACLNARSGLDAGLVDHLLCCYDAMRTWRGPVAPCHGDAHPGNWVLTAAGPVLLDFDRVALGPVGFDEVFVLSSLEIATSLRARWLETAGVSAEVAGMVSGALAARIAIGLDSSSDLWRQWCAAAWRPALELACVYR